ncbi:MAG: proton-conducting transporter membrane subunit, partial [Solirubrobacteraceae bacterium]
DLGDDISAMAGIGATRPWLAWPMTIAMLSLAGIPATAGFIGKIYLIEAAVDGEYTWLGIVLVVGSMISLAYYLRVVAAMWMREAPRTEALVARPAMAGASPEADEEEKGGDEEEHGAERGPDRSRSNPEVTALAVFFGAATLFFGIIPSPIFDLARNAGAALGLL